MIICRLGPLNLDNNTINMSSRYLLCRRSNGVWVKSRRERLLGELAASRAPSTRRSMRNNQAKYFKVIQQLIQFKSNHPLSKINHNNRTHSKRHRWTTFLRRQGSNQCWQQAGRLHHKRLRKATRDREVKLPLIVKRPLNPNQVEQWTLPLLLHTQFTKAQHRSPNNICTNTTNCKLNRPAKSSWPPRTLLTTRRRAVWKWSPTRVKPPLKLLISPPFNVSTSNSKSSPT